MSQSSSSPETAKRMRTSPKPSLASTSSVSLPSSAKLTLNIPSTAARAKPSIDSRIFGDANCSVASFTSSLAGATSLCSSSIISSIQLADTKINPFLLLPEPSGNSGQLNTPHITFAAPSWPGIGYSQELETLNAAFEGSLSGLVDLAAVASPYGASKYVNVDNDDEHSSSPTSPPGPSNAQPPSALTPYLAMFHSNVNSGSGPAAGVVGNSYLAPQRQPPPHDFSSITDVIMASAEDFQQQSHGGFYEDQQRQQPYLNSNSSQPCFQYILMAPTSAAVRLHEEALTYLNQGQSYEIKCKKLGGGGAYSIGKCFKSIIRIGFHDRRQKFQEKELLQQWKQLHRGERVVEFDLPMSYGIYNPRVGELNAVEFVWDPSKQTSAFVRVNCMSTEFTARKHGGEKGVPFRLQIDTFQLNDTQEPKHVHSAYGQVKVFKTKGADRKNKTDKEKAEKLGEKERYQPGYDYTILTELFPFDVYDGDESGGSQADSLVSPVKLEVTKLAFDSVAAACRSNSAPAPSAFNPCETAVATDNAVDNHPLGCVKDELSSQSASSPTLSVEEALPEILSSDAPSQETAEWLRKHRFGNYVKIFANFAGADLLRLGRDDLIQICGVADGIRLFNALQFKQIAPKLTVYLCQPGAPAYNAVFLFALTLQELVRKVSQTLLQVDPSQILDVYCEGPGDTLIQVTDEVVRYMQDKCRFVIDLMKSQETERDTYRMLLKSPKGG